MSSFFIQTADSIVQELQEAPADSFARSLGKIERIYDPQRQPEGLEELRVDVILGDRKTKPISRALKENDCRVDIGFRQVVKSPAGSTDEQAELDALIELVEQVEAFFTNPPRRLKYADFAAWTETELVYPYLPSHVRTRQFTSILRLTYRIATK